MPSHLFSSQSLSVRRISESCGEFYDIQRRRYSEDAISSQSQGCRSPGILFIYSSHGFHFVRTHGGYVSLANDLSCKLHTESCLSLCIAFMQRSISSATYTLQASCKPCYSSCIWYDLEFRRSPPCSFSLLWKHTSNILLFSKSEFFDDWLLC